MTELNNETIIYFGPEPWEGMWRNRHQLMTRFARSNNVIYVEPRKSLQRVLKELLSHEMPLSSLFRPVFSTTPEGVFLFHFSPLYSETDKPFLKAVFDFLWRGKLRRKIAKLGVNSPIIWLSRPEYRDQAGVFREKQLVYHVVDEYTGYYGQSDEWKRKIIADERALLKQADAVIVVSETLRRSKSEISDRVYLVPNAVDFDSYSSATAVAKQGSSPLVGYTGLIGNRLDLEMLNALAEKHPEWDFGFVGDVVEKNCEDIMAQLIAQPNVRLFGRKSMADLPSVVKSFDVAMIPYKQDVQAENVSPLKIYEYMAAGLPIVTTDFSASREFNDVVFLSRDADEFERGIQKALSADDDVVRRIKSGRAVAKTNTWEDRVRLISQILTD